MRTIDHVITASVTQLAERGVDRGWNWPDTLITLGLLGFLIALVAGLLYVLFDREN